MTDQPYRLSQDQIKQLVNLPGGGIATNRITVEGLPVRFMYRDEPSNPHDSGWCFFSGVNEDDDYVNDPANSNVFSLNTIANYDETIIPYLTAPVGSVFEKPEGSDEWQVVTDFAPAG